MYKSSIFKAANPDYVIELMRDQPFAVLMGVDQDNKPVATQVPVLVEERENGIFLLGHIMRNTSHHIAFEYNGNVMALFHGPHCYISADWYETQTQASTWNYLSVQVAGMIKFLGENELKDILNKTTTRFEKEASNASYEALPDVYVSKHLPAIIGFEIQVVSINHTFKLSQNKDAKTFDAILHHLDLGDEQSRAIATHMRKNRTT